MRKNSIKNTRVNAEVQRELSNILRGGIKDPRVAPLTSVVAVEVARTVNMRNTPQITFIVDQSIEYGVNISKKIDEVTRDLKDGAEE